MAEQKTENPENAYLRAIFFDMDNTIIQTRHADEGAIDEMMYILTTDYGVPGDISEYMCERFLVNFRKCPDNPPMSLDAWRKSLWAESFDEEYKYLAATTYWLWLEIRYKHLALDNYTKYILGNLREKYRLALITNGTSNGQWEKVNRLNLTGYFDHIIVSGDQAYEKPDPMIFYDACKALGVKHHQAIMIGDKLETDILGGNKAKLGATVWIPLTEGTEVCRDDPAFPDFVITHLLELEKELPTIIEFLKEKSESQPERMDVSMLAGENNSKDEGDDS